MDDELTVTGAQGSPDDWQMDSEDEGQEMAETDNEETAEDGDANNEGAQYDEDGYLIEDGETQEEVVESEPVAVVPARSTRAALPAPTVAIPQLTEAQRAQLDELYITDQDAWFNMKLEMAMAARDQTQRAGNHYVREFQASAPDFMADYGPRVQAIVEDVTRQNPNVGQDAINLGVLGVVLEDSRANGNDIRKAIARANEKLNGKPVRPTPPAPKPLPAAQRVVSPSNSGASVRQPSTGSTRAGQQAARNGSTASVFLAKHLGLEPDTAQGFATDLKKGKR